MISKLSARLLTFIMCCGLYSDVGFAKTIYFGTETEVVSLVA